MSELRKKTYHGFLWAGLEQFGASFLGFITQIILARILLPAEFGVFGLILIINTIADIISDSGMSTSIIRTENTTEKDYNTVFFSNLVISFLLYIILFLAAPAIAGYYNEPIMADIIPVYAISIPISSFFSMQNTILRKALNFKSITAAALPAIIISSILGIVLGYLGFGVWALVIMYLTKLLIQAVILTIKSKWLPRFSFDFAILRIHFGFGNKLLLATILGKTAQNITGIVIGKSFSIAEVGYYTRADGLKNFPVLSFTSLLEKVAYPVLAQMQSNTEKVIFNYKKMLSLAIFIMSALMLCLILISKPLILLLLSNTWQNSIPYLQWLCVIGIFYPFGVFSHNIILLKGKSNIILFLSIIMEVATIIGVIYFAQFSIIAIIVFSIALQVFMIPLTMLYLEKLYQYRVINQLISLAIYIIPALSAFIFSHFMINFLKIGELNNAVQIIIDCSIFFTILFVIIVVLKNETYRNIIEILKFKAQQDDK